MRLRANSLDYLGERVGALLPNLVKQAAPRTARSFTNTTSTKKRNTGPQDCGPAATAALSSDPNLCHEPLPGGTISIVKTTFFRVKVLHGTFVATHSSLVLRSALET